MFKNTINQLESLKDHCSDYADECNRYGTEDIWTADVNALEVAISVLEKQWHPADEEPTNEETEYILCISGTRRNITYCNAVVTDANYEGGNWYLEGLRLDKDITVHYWMELPEPYVEGGGE